MATRNPFKPDVYIEGPGGTIEIPGIIDIRMTTLLGKYPAIEIATKAQDGTIGRMQFSMPVRMDRHGERETITILMSGEGAKASDAASTVNVIR